MKSEKGLTFLSTAILVVVIALMAFVVVYYGRMQVSKEKTVDIKTDILRVKAKVQSISTEYTLKKKDEVLVGTKLSDMKEDQAVKEFLERELFDADKKGKKYYVLNQENLNDLGLNNVVLENDSYYIVEYTAGDVYYTKGYTDEAGEVHYQVKDIEKEIDEQNKDEEQNNKQSESTEKEK